MIDRVRRWRPRWPSLYEDEVSARRIALFFISVLLLIVAAIPFTLPHPISLVAASVRAETLEIVIWSPDSAEFRLPRARLGERGPCVSNIAITPHNGSTVYYTRPIGAPLVIAVKGRSTWWTDTMPRKAVTFLALYLDPRDRTCAADFHLRLPVSGYLAIGTVTIPGAQREWPMPILSGDLKVYGRPVDSILGGRLPLTMVQNLTSAGPRNLYAAETIALPAGSRLGAAYTGAADRSPHARWWGFVDADMTEAGRSDRGLWIEASANASTVKLIPPAPSPLNPAGQVHLDSELISLTIAERLVGDPNIRWLLGFVSFALLLLGVVAQLLSVPSPRKPNSMSKTEVLPERIERGAPLGTHDGGT